MFMEQRRIIPLGRSSLVISLPKYWTQLAGLKAGDTVSLAIGRDRSLVIFPGIKKEKEASSITLYIEPDEKDVSIARKIIACYLNNYSNIKLVSKSFFTVNQQRVIRKTSQMLYMSVMEANVKEIRIATLIDESQAPMQLGITRMHKIASSMCYDALTALKNQDSSLAKSVYALDDEVDHFSFFLLRLIRKASANPALANSLGLEPLDCLEYQIFIYCMEHIANHAVNIAKHIVMLEGRGKIISEDVREKMYVIGHSILANYNEAVNALISNDIKNAESKLIKIIEDYTRLGKLDQEISSLAFSREKDMEIICACCSIRDSILRIAEYTIDIAETALHRSYRLPPII